MIAVDEIFDEHRSVRIESDINSLKALGAKFRLKLLHGASGVDAGRTCSVDELDRYYFAEVIAQSPLPLRGIVNEISGARLGIGGAAVRAKQHDRNKLSAAVRRMLITHSPLGIIP